MKIYGFWKIFFCLKLSKNHSEFERRKKKDVSLPDSRIEKSHQIEPNHTILVQKSQEIVPTYNGWHSDADLTHSFSFFWRILIFHFYFGDQAIFIEFIVVRSNTNRFKFFIEIVKTRFNWFYIFLTEYYSIGLNLKKSYP